MENETTAMDSSLATFFTNTFDPNQIASDLAALKSFINQELAALAAAAAITSTTLTASTSSMVLTRRPRDLFLVYKSAFEQLIAATKSYRTLLVAIKRELDSAVARFEHEQSARDSRIARRRHAHHYSLTLANLEKRKSELIAQLNELTAHNHRLLDMLHSNSTNSSKDNENEQAQANVEPSGGLTSETTRATTAATTTTTTATRRRHRLIAGIDMEQATDLEYLEQMLAQLRVKSKQFDASKADNYCARSVKLDMERQLLAKIQRRDEMLAKREAIKSRTIVYKMALKIAEDYYAGRAGIAGIGGGGVGRAKTMRFTSIQDALGKTLLNSVLERQRKNEAGSGAGEGSITPAMELAGDDIVLDDESDLILDYIERFNDMFDKRRYAEAAQFAAVSPRNVLRNLETLMRFKNIRSDEEEEEGGESSRPFTMQTDPLLAYCQAVLDSMTSGSQPNEAMSVECIRAALRYNLVETITRWVAHKRLTLSPQAAAIVEQHGKRMRVASLSAASAYYELALFIYVELGRTHEACVCLTRLGRHNYMLSTLKTTTSSGGANEWHEAALRVLAAAPDVELANLVVAEFEASSSVAAADDLIERIIDALLANGTLGLNDALRFVQAQLERRAASDPSADFDRLAQFWNALTCASPSPPPTNRDE